MSRTLLGRGEWCLCTGKRKGKNRYYANVTMLQCHSKYYIIFQVVVDCSVVGHVSLSIDPCVFSLGESDFPELYTVFPNATMSHSTDPTCFRKIETTTTSLEWSWTYAEAADCGWEWSQSDTQISFSSVLRAALTVDFQGQDLTVAKFPEEISVPCNFNSIMSITAEITAEESTVTTQNAEASGNMTLATGFSVSLVDDANVAKTSFTVGETIEAKVQLAQPVLQIL